MRRSAPIKKPRSWNHITPPQGWRRACVFIACCITESKDRWAVTQECSPPKTDLVSGGSTPARPRGMLIQQSKDLWELFISMLRLCWCLNYFTWMNKTLTHNAGKLGHSITSLIQMEHRIPRNSKKRNLSILKICHDNLFLTLPDSFHSRTSEIMSRRDRHAASKVGVNKS